MVESPHTDSIIHMEWRTTLRKWRKSAKKKLGSTQLIQRLRKSAISSSNVVLVPYGGVTTLSRREILGEIAPRDRAGILRVRLFVNDLEIAATDVSINSETASSFRFALRDIWLYCGPQDKITVQVNGSRLPLPNGQLFYCPRSKAKSPLSELERRILAGEIMNSAGILSLPKYLDVEWQRTATELYWALYSAIKGLVGYDIFLVYGSLLGAVREGRPLGHDLDFDAAYMSKNTNKEDVVSEAVEIAKALREHGFSIEVKATCIQVSNPEHTQNIDLYYYSFDESGKLRLVLGQASDVPFGSEQWDGLREVEYAGSTVMIPHNAEDLVATLYGKDWRIPNPGFNWTSARVSRAADATLPQDFRITTNWEDYWTFAYEAPPSSFAQLIDGMELGCKQVVDLGCGDGRDSSLFVESGMVALGLDKAFAAIQKATSRSLPLQSAHFTQCAFEDENTFETAIENSINPNLPTLYYARNLFDSVPIEVQDKLLNEIKNRIQPNDHVAFEVRTPNGAGFSPNHRRNHGRREVDPSTIKVWAEESGFEIIVDEESTEWAHEAIRTASLYRIVARQRA